MRMARNNKEDSSLPTLFLIYGGGNPASWNAVIRRSPDAMSDQEDVLGLEDILLDIKVITSPINLIVEKYEWA